ncbi:hypothetical protein RhiirA1_464112 [Rhizophagus irregularis]|uniref:CCHC-type domain-containing protein n=1 Tax=Rhizophagus irregularis TaxID=588596 RepID=A0A2N0RIN6_9GLOM|nr:hypothetical protein RhiirA1_464112 [Rhizophagus irregularis]
MPIRNQSTLNSVSNLCEIGNTIDKRHENELQYCKLVNLKAYQTTVGLPHLLSQFFSSCLISSLDENLDIETASDNFIEDIIDKSQIIIKSLLSVILLDDETHLCICLETITKDSILTNLDINLKNFLILTAIETTTDTSTLFQITLCTFQSLHCIQRSDNNEVIRQNTNQRNRFGIAFFTVKTAVNIALETNSDHELIQLLKDFIEAKQEKNVDNNDNVNHDIIEINESNQENDNIVLLQKNLIEQITSPYVTKVRGLHQKKRLRSAMEISKRRVLMQEIIDKSNDQPIKQQRKCLLYGKFGHYQKKCSGNR